MPTEKLKQKPYMRHSLVPKQKTGDDVLKSTVWCLVVVLKLIDGHSTAVAFTSNSMNIVINVTCGMSNST
jgi:hypothetical protein